MMQEPLSRSHVCQNERHETRDRNTWRGKQMILHTNWKTYPASQPLPACFYPPDKHFPRLRDDDGDGIRLAFPCSAFVSVNDAPM